MRILRIGVLTFHRCINYGSYWQARCLTEGLQARGHISTILDHDSRRVNIAEWKCAFRPVLPTHVPESDYPLYRQKIKRFFSAFETLPLSGRFDLDTPDQMPSYDAIVVGSDEVWNLYHPWFGRNPLFYGDGLRTEHLISYAASFGNYPADHGLDPVWAEKLKNFERISVRDENSRTIVRNAIGTDPEIVLDPCLQFDIHPEDRENPYLHRPYLAVYGHNFSSSFIAKTKAWAEHNKLPLISIGYRNDWADEQWISADPHDFAHFMAGAAAVTTNFFHGCVFAIRNQKPFVCEISDYRSYKVQGLMSTIGAQQHLISEQVPGSVVNARLNIPLDPEIFQNLTRLRQSSNAFLDQALYLKHPVNESFAQS